LRGGLVTDDVVLEAATRHHGTTRYIIHAQCGPRIGRAAGSHGN
jgi:hypothetical protein